MKWTQLNAEGPQLPFMVPKSLPTILNTLHPRRTLSSSLARILTDGVPFRIEKNPTSEKYTEDIATISSAKEVTSHNHSTT